ncbi:MAG: hypothetical protein DMG97_04335 [Acidobacteria bacterium]|nr:MAG: hypothetical protein DME33_09740 [Verrucomicrobiota bacterium]PYV76354.1 MAG: hypothetical protein DMG97_04335 [Acidobacteriota bacterium]
MQKLHQVKLAVTQPEPQIHSAVSKNPQLDHTSRGNYHGTDSGELRNSSGGPRLGKYPLLEALLDAQGLTLKGAYRYSDVTEIFDCSIRALQERVRDGQLTVRDLPGRKKFLAQDLENFLKNSVRKPKRRVEDK